jgi:glycolate dehydrogenase iron-sulfur subunit
MPSAFDAHHPPSPAVLDTCVHCGFCLATCPTYVLWGQEMDSPRGRIYLMQLAREGAVTMTPEWVSHFDTCLGCMACMPACPSGVDYGQLIEATRAQIERRYERSAAERLFRRLLFATLPRPERLRLLAWPMAAYRRSGLQWLVRKSGALELLPPSLRAMDALLPSGRREVSVCCSGVYSGSFSRRSTRQPRVCSRPRATRWSRRRINPAAARCSRTPAKKPGRWRSPDA